jgi:hypothetical protein
MPPTQPPTQPQPQQQQQQQGGRAPNGRRGSADDGGQGRKSGGKNRQGKGDKNRGEGGNKRPTGPPFLNRDYTNLSTEDQLRLLERAHEWYGVFFRAFTEQNIRLLTSSAAERWIASDIVAAVQGLEAAYKKARLSWPELTIALEQATKLAAPTGQLTVNGALLTLADGDAAERWFWDGLVKLGTLNLREVVRTNFSSLAMQHGCVPVGLAFDPTFNHFYAYIAVREAANEGAVSPSYVHAFRITASGMLHSVNNGLLPIEAANQAINNRPLIWLIQVASYDSIARRFS